MTINYNFVSLDPNASQQLLKNFYDFNAIEVVFQTNFGSGEVFTDYPEPTFDWEAGKKELLLKRKNLWDELARL
jgi:hypothetical protein